MSYSEAKALKVLATVKDPVSGRDIVSAGILGDLAQKDGIVRAVLKVDPARSEDYAKTRLECETVLSKLEGIHTAQVILTAHTAAPILKSAQSKRAVQPHQARRPDGYQGDAFIDRVIAVSSAKGGVGKSTMSVNLAVALSKLSKRVGLLDADVHGPSLPTLLGLSGQMAETVSKEGRTLIKPFEAFGIKAMSIGFLTKDDGPVVWRGPMVQGAISKMLWDVDWGALDILIIDMPPGTGDAQLGLAQDIKPKGAVIVSTPQDLALLDARKGVAMFQKVDIPILGVIENMSVFTCPDCGTHHKIFGSDGAKVEAKKLGVPFLGAAPLLMDIRLSGDSGVPIAGSDTPSAEMFKGLAKSLLTEL
mgnify:CR=1 FL=1